MADPAESLHPTTRRKRPARARPKGRRYECTFNGCGRFYSRAEHLQRHQLNHAPKQLFICPLEACSQSFVRRDLYLRHKARHGQHNLDAGSSDEHQTTTSPCAQVYENTTTAITSPRFDGLAFPAEENLPGSGPSVTAQEYTQPTALAMSQDDPTQIFSGAQEPVSILPALASQRPHEALPSQIAPRPSFPATREVPSSASPSSVDEFAAWLFEGHTVLQGQPNFLDMGMNGGYYSEDLQNFPISYTDSMPTLNDPTFPDSLADPEIPTNGRKAELATPRSHMLSNEKWTQLIELITGKLLESTIEQSERITHDFEDERNAFSMYSMQLYIESYWRSFHESLPILHHPTFKADSTHNYLLMAMMLLGSSMAIRQEGYKDRGMKNTHLIAWNLRGHVLLHVDANPPGRLWVFQTLLLLEIHDKLFASSALHERALVYFPTTLNLMRQSSTLFGRQVPKSTVSGIQPGARNGGSKAELSVGFFAPKKSPDSPPESWWEHWIVQEAIRRAAFAAFILDVTHSVMFGQNQTLVFHELHLFLPCDRLLWSSNSPNEIGAVESSLYANGVKQLSFLDGLRKMINRKPCRANPLGWLILLAGLLSVIGHMQQRDLLTSSLKYDLASPSHEKWQPRLINALLWWKKEYDENMSHLRGATLDWQKFTLAEGNGRGETNDIALVTILYHLGNINVYITMPELSVAAGASKLLGRPVSPFEKRMIKEKIRQWASTSDAMHALYHAFRLVRVILFSCAYQQDIRDQSSQTHNQQDYLPKDMPEYEAAYDKLPNRAWALYFSTLVIWAYGLNQDGQLDPFPHELEFPPTDTAVSHAADFVPSGSEVDTLSTQSFIASNEQSGSGSINEVLAQSRRQDAQIFIDTMFPSSIDSPEKLGQHLRNITSGRNKLIGLLSVVYHGLRGSNWDLLDEARQRLACAATYLKTGLTA